jgi:hypothetical protein
LWLELVLVVGVAIATVPARRPEDVEGPDEPLRRAEPVGVA